MTPLERLASLSLGFRSRFLTYDEVTKQLHAWADAFPDVARVESIGQSTEGRDLWVLTLGPEPSRLRPAAWVDGNMHATELCGSSVALAIAEDVLALHLAPDDALTELALPAPVRARLKEILVYAMPRISPDGAEAVLQKGRYVRSNPRDRRHHALAPRWLCEDVDGDGLSLLMRKVDVTGEFVESTARKGLLVPRTLDDEGPFYKLYPEGVIANYDGKTVPDPYFLSDNDTDLNRNFPWSWLPEPEQAGAGSYPLSEPEAQALVAFVSARPHIFSWLNLHTFGGVYIRPLGHKPDSKMEPSDLAVFRQVADYGERYGGYPTVSGFEEFTYEPDKPLHGDLTDFAYHQRGSIAYVCELWDLFQALGIPRKKPFVDHYTHFTRANMEALAAWDATHNKGRILRPWRAVNHPQLGAVEVGGLDPRIGMSNPPLEEVAGVCARQSAAYLRVAAMAPALRAEVTRNDPLDANARRIEVTIRNEGYLPTFVLASAKKLPWNEPLYAEARATGCVLASTAESMQEIGHLEGWGRGLFDESASIFYQRSRGSRATRTLGFTVTGRGVLTVKVGGHRVGHLELRIEV